jgi:hypothetical protein
MIEINIEQLIARGQELYEQNGNLQDSDGQNIPEEFWDNFDNNVPVWNESADVDNSVMEEVEKHGIDSVLAIYKPISLHGDKAWGIRYYHRAIQSYINYVYKKVLAIEPNAKYTVVAELVFQSIRRHEYEHFVQEMVYLGGTLGATSVENYSIVIADQSLCLETNATHFEILDSWSAKGDKRIRNIVLLALSDVVRHGPYAAWRAADVEAADLNFEHRVSTWSSELRAKPIRARTRKSSTLSMVSEIRMA